MLNATNTLSDAFVAVDLTTGKFIAEGSFTELAYVTLVKIAGPIQSAKGFQRVNPIRKAGLEGKFFGHLQFNSGVATYQNGSFKLFRSTVDEFEAEVNGEKISLTRADLEQHPCAYHRQGVYPEVFGYQTPQEDLHLTCLTLEECDKAEREHAEAINAKFKRLADEEAAGKEKINQRREKIKVLEGLMQVKATINQKIEALNAELAS